VFDDDAAEDDDDKEVGVCAVEAPEEEADKGDTGDVLDVLRPPFGDVPIVVVIMPLC
jgi:hypothetical protein